MNQLAYSRLVITSLSQPGRLAQCDHEHRHVFQLIVAQDGVTCGSRTNRFSPQKTVARRSRSPSTLHRVSAQGSPRGIGHTLRVLADPRATADDVSRPGHVLPVRCADGGFAQRPRPWELAVDLCTAAGHPPVVVMRRLVDDAGEVLDGLTATLFALNHHLALCAWASDMDTLPTRVSLKTPAMRTS